MTFPFKYHLSKSAVEIRVGGLTVRRVRYRDIENVREGYVLWNEHWNNVWPWRCVTIRRKTGLIRNFVINPSDRGEFMKELRERMEAKQAFRK